MKKKLLICFFAAGMFTMYSCETKQRKDSVEVAEEKADQRFDTTAIGNTKKENVADFMIKAANKGMFEVEAAKIAAEKATNPKVKEFARMMQNEHTKSNNELKHMAQMQNIPLPAAIGDDMKDKIEDLREARIGEDFDKVYMDAMVDTHKDALDEYKDAADNADWGKVKDWASTTAPKIAKQEEMAEQVRESVKNYKYPSTDAPSKSPQHNNKLDKSTRDAY